MLCLLSGPSRTRMGRGPVHIEVQTELLARTRLKRATPSGWPRIRLRSSSDCGAISLDREVFGAIADEDGALTLHLGGVEVVIARRSA